jgi:serine/threonine protein kinase
VAHDEQIMHRDIKPENIFIKDLKLMNIKIGDFGCSKS